MRNPLRLRLQHLYIIESAIVGFFFVSALRFLIGLIYSRVAGAQVIFGLEPSLIPAGTRGVFDAATLTNEISFLVYMLAIPLLTLILGRFRWLQMVAIVMLVAGRYLMIAESAVTPVTAASMAVGGGLLYVVMTVRYRIQTLPFMFVLGFGLDQVARAIGNTLDITWSANAVVVDLAALLNVQGVITSFLIQGVLFLLVIVLGIVTILSQQRQGNEEGENTNSNGLMPFWGGIGLGGLLFIELSFLAMPNAIAGRSATDYTNLAPFVTLATLLPLIAWVRHRVSAFVDLFDRSLRGWSWLLLLALLLVVGMRLPGLVAGIALVIAQFFTSLLWWWIARPRADKERGFTGLWIVVGVLLLFLLTTADNFTYEYAYVPELTSDYAFLNDVVPPFLRGFRGLGLGVILLSTFLATLPMIQTQRRTPWSIVSGSSIISLVIVALFSLTVAAVVRPPIIQGVRSTTENPLDSIRIGTYNIHAGFNEFYAYDLEAIARTIQQSGANVVMLQQVEAGRLTSFGVDQALWLARRLGMATRFFPTNEGLQGLATLSNIEVSDSEGILLTSKGNQTGVQRLEIRPDSGFVTLYNTRLEFLLETGDGRTIEQQEQDQQRQLSEIFAILSKRYPDGNLGRLVVGGTFNNTPNSPLGEQMRATGFFDPFTGLPAELAATLWRTGYPRVQFDYLWVWRGTSAQRPNTLTAVGANTIDTTASDHRMMVIEALLSN